MVVFLTFLGLIFLRVIVITVGAALLVRRVRACPACFEPTTPVMRPWVERLTGLEWRWCTHCGWRGLSRPARKR